MNENRKIKFAIVGSGHIGKRHAEMIRRNPESELVAMCDIKDKSEIGLSDVDVPFFSTIESLLNSGIDFEVLSVCSPNGLHADHTLKALDYKKMLSLKNQWHSQWLIAKKLFSKLCRFHDKFFV